MQKRPARATLAAAALIACGMLVWLGRLLLPLGQSTVTLAETLATMRTRPWIHVVQSGASDGGVYEYWECFDARTRARKLPRGRISYANYGANVMYAYNPNANKITVSFTTDSYMVGPQWEPVKLLSEAVERAAAAGTETSREVAVENGVRVERIQVEYESEGRSLAVTYVRDVARNVLLRTEATVVKDGQTSRHETTFDYPDEGPADIYALGVPRPMQTVMDIRPEGPALALVDKIQERFERGFGDYLAVVLISWGDEDGERSPTEIAVLRQQNGRKRSDVYCAYDFKNRPEAPSSLYAQVKETWPDLTVAQVLEIADANALDRRMLFDGERTIRWRREDGELIRDEMDEMGVDKFKLPPAGPAPHSLTSMVWPNLHLRVQMGSSQLKREVRLLPEDPNRPGLVGLQFVGFAEREDYWFDPDKDYMQIERVKKQEGQGVTSRFIVAQSAEISEGRWYPQVIRHEWTSTDTGTVSRQEWRVLLDADPAFDESVFALTAPAGQEATEPNASTVSPEAEPTEPNDIQAEEAWSDTGVAGCVRDMQGRPVAAATVLLYHNRSRYGLGNRVVEQAQTDGQGRYGLTTPIEYVRRREHSYAQDSYILIAAHPDHAFAWQNLTQGRESSRYDLTLTAATSRTIRVTDHEGNPLPGARVWLYSAGDRKSQNPLFRDYLSLPTDIGPLGVSANADGIAVMTNLPDTGCSFHATVAGYAQGLAFPGQHHIQLSPGASVSGWVLTDAGTPVGGAMVRFKTEWMWDFYLAETDSAGHFAFVDLPARGWDMGPWGEQEGANGTYTVYIRHPELAAPETSLTLEPGEVIEDMTITASTETALVRCTVLEEGTDTPLGGVRISGTTETGSIDGFSDANGVYSVALLPGPVSLRFYSPPDGVYTRRDDGSRDHRVTFEATPGEVDVTLRTPPIAGELVTVSGIVQDPDGSPVSNAVVYADGGQFQAATVTSYVPPTGADTNGAFALKGVPAGRDLHLYVESQDRMLALAATVHIPDDANETEPLELVLHPTKTAATMIADEQGDPFTEVNLTFSPVVGGRRIWPAERRGSINDAGLLEIEGIVPGLSYRLLDVRLDQARRDRDTEWEKWLDREMVLIPGEP